MKEERLASSSRARSPILKLPPSQATRIADIEVIGEHRRRTGIGEFDRVLGGGVVPGSMILIGGDPGSAKPHSSCKPYLVSSQATKSSSTSLVKNLLNR